MATFQLPLPPFEPPRSLVPTPIREARELMDRSAHDALQWAAAIQTTFERERMYMRFPGFQFASYGALNPEIDGGPFGVAVHAAAAPWGEGAHDMRVGDAKFRLAVRTDEELTLHRPTDPERGTSTCWALSTRLAAGKEYALTAEHTVGALQGGDPVGAQKTGIGNLVPLAGGGTAEIKDIGPPGIDATLLDVGSPHGSLASFSTITYPAPWTPVTIEGAHNNVPTMFMRSSDVTGSMHHLLPIRLFLEQAAQPGDSGALVPDASGTGIGLYMGEVANPAGVREGVCQHLGQIEHAMALTLLT